MILWNTNAKKPLNIEDFWPGKNKSKPKKQSAKEQQQIIKNMMMGF